METDAQQNRESPPACETVLLAAVGTAPAVVTETLYALARESPPCIPTRVVAVTTVVGRNSLRRGLHGADAGCSSPWRQFNNWLRSAHPTASPVRFGDTGDDIRVPTRAMPDGRTAELSDIRDRDDSETCADFLLELVRGFVANPDVRLVVSIAGGRKTMGALLYGCMTLLGRPSDRITHVLVTEPFDSPLTPPFYFPEQDLSDLVTRDGRVVCARDATVGLADVPFVPLSRACGRSGHPGVPGLPAGSFMNQVRRATAAVPDAALDGLNLRVSRNSRKVEIIPPAPSDTANPSGASPPLPPRIFSPSAREQIVLLFFASLLTTGQTPPGDDYEVVVAPLNAFLKKIAAAQHWALKINPLDSRDLTRVVSSLRQRFHQAGAAGQLIATRLPCRGRMSLDLPASQVEIVV